MRFGAFFMCGDKARIDDSNLVSILTINIWQKWGQLRLFWWKFQTNNPGFPPPQSQKCLLSALSHFFYWKKKDLWTKPGCVEDCSAMHKSWTIGPLHGQKLILASAKAQPIWYLLSPPVLMHCGLLSMAWVCLPIRLWLKKSLEKKFTT